MHDIAVKFLVGFVEDVASGERLNSPRSINEDGHGDVESSRRAMKAIAEDAMQMLQALEQMDGNLPTWWTNKMANAKYMMNAMRDYLLIPSMEEKLKPSDGAGAYVDDFRKSKAPQFKGKSKKKKQQMAIAAYLDDKDSKK
jgi:hypothetical protein